MYFTPACLSWHRNFRKTLIKCASTYQRKIPSHVEYEFFLYIMAFVLGGYWGLDTLCATTVDLMSVGNHFNTHTGKCPHVCTNVQKNNMLPLMMLICVYQQMLSQKWFTFFSFRALSLLVPEFEKLPGWSFTMLECYTVVLTHKEYKERFLIKIYY
jgi:hypothetical protein